MVRQVFRGDPMEAAEPLQPSVVGIAVIDMKIRSLRVGLAGRRQDVCRDAGLAGKRDNRVASIAAELIGRRDHTTQPGRDRNTTATRQHCIPGTAFSVTRDNHRDLFGGLAASRAVIAACPSVCL